MNALTVVQAALEMMFRASWQGSVLAGIVLLLQGLLRHRLSASARYLLWSIVILRLLLPIVPQSRWSIFNLHSVPAEATPAIATSIRHEIRPAVVFVSASEPRAPSVAPARRITPMQWMAIIWLSGAMLLALCVGISCLAMRRLIRGLATIDDTKIHELVAAIAASLQLRRRPVLLAGDSISVPALVGMWRPVLLLPRCVLEQCTADELRLIVSHELVHLKRCDVLGNWIITLICLIHWMNPIVWLLAARIRVDRELACDEQVLMAHGGNERALAYGQMLLKLIEILSVAPSVRPAPMVGILERSGPMKRRILMIARFDSKRTFHSIWVFGIVFALGCVAVTDRVTAQRRGGPAPTTAPTTRQFIIVPKWEPWEPMAKADPDEAALAALQKILPEVRFDGIPIGDVIDFLRDFSGANIVVNWRALETAGIDQKETKVTARLQNVKFSKALDVILHDVGGGTIKLDYVVDNGVITISTNEDLAGMTETILYDVSDLMKGGDGVLLAPKDLDNRISQLANTIRALVAPESWNNSPGGKGSIESFSSKLIIRATTRNQQEITRLLERLREAPTTAPRPLGAN